MLMTARVIDSGMVTHWFCYRVPCTAVVLWWVYLLNTGDV